MAWTKYFDSQYTFRVQILQLVLIGLAVILTFVRFGLTTITTRGHIMALTMGIKSIVVITYEILSSHTARFAKWKSLKAYAILNTLEILFWAVAMGLLFQANSMICDGASCGVSWVVAILAMVLLFIAMWTSVSSILEFRHSKRAPKYEPEARL